MKIPLILRSIQHHAGDEAVALLIENPFGGAEFVNTSQTDLQARAPAWRAWSDAEALAIASEAMSATLAQRTPGLECEVVLSPKDVQPYAEKEVFVDELLRAAKVAAEGVDDVELVAAIDASLTRCASRAEPIKVAE